MEPISAIAGPFRFDGLLRMPEQLTLDKQMGILRDPFLMLYEVAVSSALEPQKKVEVPMVLIRPSEFAFTS